MKTFLKWDLFVDCITVIWLVIFFTNIAKPETIPEGIEYGLLSVFVGDLVVKYRRVSNFRVFMRRHWTDILMVIPYFRILRFFRLIRFIRVLRIARITRVGRYPGLKAVIGFAKKSLRIIKWTKRHPGASVKIPRYAPSNPPKNYNKKKAISIFCCLWFSFGLRCPELLRATTTTKGDIYIIPYTEYVLRDYHLSYHKSGKFHWVLDGTHTKPVYGETDFASAFGLWLKVRRPPCFCFRKGKNLKNEEIVSLLKCLAQNFPFPFDVGEASQNLKDAKFYRLVQPEFKQRE